MFMTILLIILKLAHFDRKRAMQHQIECLETQKRALASNYERIQQQLVLSQSRLKRSNRMVEEVEGRYSNC